MVLHYTIPYYTILYYTMLYYTVLYDTFYTVLYYTIPEDQVCWSLACQHPLTSAADSEILEGGRI